MPSDDATLREALESLSRVLRQEIEEHPSGHLGPGRVPTVRLEVLVPVGGDAGEGHLEEARAEVRRAAETLLLRRSVLRPGRVWCLRCASADCEHARIEDPRAVFTGWGPSGLPEFRDFAQWLLERRHDHIDRLYREPPGFVADVVSGRELASRLLEPFQDDDEVRIHGQVVAGWYRVPRADAPGEQLLAITIQVVSTRGRKRRRQLGLQIIGSGLEDGEAEHLVRRMGRLPWADSLRWGQGILDQVQRMQRRPGVRATLLSRRLEGTLKSIARRLSQDVRSRSRRTAHAEERHRQGDRPTRTAVRDLQQAGEDDVLRDRLRSTWIVLGEKSRAHVFSDGGKLVTSLRSSPDATRRKREKGRWTRASPEQAEDLRRAVLGGNV